MNKFTPEVCERAVRLVLGTQSEHGLRWRAVVSIAAKIDSSTDTLNEWVSRSPSLIEVT